MIRISQGKSSSLPPQPFDCPAWAHYVQWLGLEYRVEDLEGALEEGHGCWLGMVQFVAPLYDPYDLDLSSLKE